MPGMRVFGKRCALATDDFFFIGAIDSIIFLPWLAWIPVIYASYLRERNNCQRTSSLYLTDVSLPSLCVLFFLNWFVSCLFVIFSVKGTISKPEPRRHIVSLVYMKLFISVLDIACAVLGTVIIVNNSYCDIIGLPLLIKVTTSFQWLATVARFCMVIIFYDWNSSKNTKLRIQKEYFTHQVRRGTMKRWNFRFQALFLWCTTPSEARKQAIKTASELMALLSCDLDLVASDVIAGLLLYRQKCLRRWKNEKMALNAAPPISESDGEKLDQFPPSNMKEWMNLQLASRYFDLGLGIFGWPWYIYRHLSCGCCHIIKRLICCFPFRRFSKNVLGDNCCGCNLVGLQATTKLPYEDLVHVSFVDRVFEVPFFVTFDHQTKAVVLTVRGTMSVDDVLTDVAAAFAVMDDPGCPQGALCHHGMLIAAREIKSKVVENGILEKAFEQTPDYRLVVTGHSLGASVASIVTILLKESYPDVRCYAFAPPPIVNKATLPFTFENIFTIVYGNDSVAYLNYENTKNMVIEMVKCLEECDLPKFKVFLNLKKPDDSVTDEENGCNDISEGKMNGNGIKCGVENNIIIEEAVIDTDGVVPCVTESLYVAGTIIHIRQAEDGYRIKLTKADEYKPLVFRPNMIFHHFPQNIQDCLHHLGKTQVVDSKALLYALE